jgi:hypothetical protein
MKESLRYWRREIAYWINEVIFPMVLIVMFVAFEGWLIYLSIKF